MQIEPTKNDQEKNESETDTEKKADLLDSDEAKKMPIAANATVDVEQSTESEKPNSTEFGETRADDVERIEKCLLEMEQKMLEYVLKQLHSNVPLTDDELEERTRQQRSAGDDDADKSTGDVPSALTPRTMDEVYEAISDEQNAKKHAKESAARKLSTQKALTKSVLDKVVAQFGEMRRHQIIAKVYELINAQTQMAIALMADEAKLGAQKGPIDAYFALFKQFMDDLLQDNMPNCINGDKLLAIMEKIENPKENVKFGEELTAMESIGTVIGELKRDLRAKNEAIAEETESISEGVQSVAEYQFGQHMKNELSYLAKDRTNSSIPLKIVWDFFGTIAFANVYLQHAKNIIEPNVLLFSPSFPLFYRRVNERLTLISEGICIIQRKAAQKLHIPEQLLHRARQIGQNFVKNVLLCDDINEIGQMAVLEGTPIALERVLLLRLSHFMHRAQLLIGRGQQLLKRIEGDFELINSVRLVTESADELAKLRLVP